MVKVSIRVTETSEGFSVPESYVVASAEGASEENLGYFGEENSEKYDILRAELSCPKPENQNPTPPLGENHPYRFYNHHDSLLSQQTAHPVEVSFSNPPAHGKNFRFTGMFLSTNPPLQGKEILRRSESNCSTVISADPRNPKLGLKAIPLPGARGRERGPMDNFVVFRSFCDWQFRIFSLSPVVLKHVLIFVTVWCQQPFYAV